MTNSIENEIQDIVGDILKDYQKGRTIDKIDIFNQPDKDVIIDIIHKLLKILFPGYYRDKFYKTYNANSHLTILMEDVIYHLNKQIAIALKFRSDYENESEEKIQKDAEQISLAFFKKIPRIRDYVETDLQAAFDGDPAARYREEIILSYPGLFAITVNRMAHELFLLNVPLIPRIMTEHAHSETGIDIHPGATIGKYFCIDHGTGIVVGETTEIGDYVKVYQGVTLGALSTRDVEKLRNKKRHPTIEDHVTIYSGASILGGETVIGEGAVIGGNAFITTSIAAGSRVSIKNQELNINVRESKSLKKSDLEQDDFWFYTI